LPHTLVCKQFLKILSPRNFHVWNDIWTKRDDLPGNKYDGWQAVDATPQEESSQLYQMGPAPLTAVKEGEVYAGFDAGFVFSEVNADIVTWVVKKDKNDEYIIQSMLIFSFYILDIVFYFFLRT
jgi:hypothetical protein